ncbi:hypothetical protein Q4574_02610 [Aliiglaciecola sp. 3_MG-2023]|uniref:hypothetical protein n=1 Tax=Aliiglaciecola sp. 3_MG-2023 TaxID=3062644 RepID=UPI0026E1FD88|nr:hypothetical protein [Aliiglaciecola sp. 3_MG-2023]MDO6692155.1 hypothetical protein [Aliiglaciecola sp. 3_MG-2023]
MKVLWFNILLMSWVASFSFSSVALEQSQGAIDQTTSIVEQAEIFNLDPFDLDLDATINSVSASAHSVNYLGVTFQRNETYLVSKNTDFIRGPPSLTI